MDRSARFAIAALTCIALVCAVAGVAIHSNIALLLAVVVGADGVLVAIVARRDGRRARSASAVRVPAAAPRPRQSSSTVSVVVPPSAAIAAAELRPTSQTVAETTPAVIQTLAEETAPQPTAPAQPEPPVREPREQAVSPTMPHGVEPADVVACLLENASAAGSPLAAHLWLEDPASATLRLVAAAGTARPDGTPEPVSGSILGRALGSRTAILQPLWRVRSGVEERTTWRFAIPLKAADARGVAAVDMIGPDEPDHAALTAIAASLRGALTGALALHVAHSETAAARTLLDTARDLSRLLEPDAVLDTALRRAMELAGAQTGSIMLVNDATGRMEIAVSSGLPLEVIETTRVAEGEGIAGWVLSTGQPLVVEDLNGRGPRSRRHGIRSAITVPIADEEGMLGVLNVGNQTFHARFSRSHLEALESLGRTTAIALRNAQSVRTTEDLYFDTIKALSIAMETRDPYAAGKTQRVIGLTSALGDAMGLTTAEAMALRIAAMLHDIGMSAAGDVVAVSNRPLSTVEWGMLKMHPVIARDILSQAPALKDVIPIVYHHHEHYDGSGYVAGLSGEAIPLGARILSVADAYVAMTSERPYRKAMTGEAAMAELLSCAGTQFDPDVVRALIELAGSDSLGDLSLRG